MPDVEQIKQDAQEKVPSLWQELAERASAHNLLMLGAGLAFFGIVSFGPAVAVGFGLLEIVASSDATDEIVDLLEDGVTDQFGLTDLIEQMEEQGGQYAGIGFLLLLWPATTLASGWTRALNDIYETGSAGPSGLLGRVRGLIPGAVLVGGLFGLFATVTLGAALLGDDGARLAAAIIVGAVAVQVALVLVIYRYLPSDRRPWGNLWRGAVWATAGVVLGTGGFAAVLAFSGDFGEQYPEQLTTAIVLGLWLYVVNTALLLGAELNAIRERRSHG
jgi:membrane protein